MMVPMDTTIAPLLLPMEAAAILRVGRSTIYRLIQSGEIATVSVGEGNGRHLRITREALRDYVNRHQSPPPEETS